MEYILKGKHGIFGDLEVRVLRFNNGFISAPILREAIWNSDSIHDTDKFRFVMVEITKGQGESRINLLTQTNLSTKFMSNIMMNQNKSLDSLKLLARGNGKTQVAYFTDPTVISSIPAPTGEGQLNLSVISYQDIEWKF